MDSSRDSRGIDVPESPCVAERSEKEEPSMKSTTIAVDVAKEVLEVAVSVRPGQISEQIGLLATHPRHFARTYLWQSFPNLRHDGTNIDQAITRYHHREDPDAQP